MLGTTTFDAGGIDVISGVGNSLPTLLPTASTAPFPMSFMNVHAGLDGTPLGFFDLSATTYVSSTGLSINDVIGDFRPNGFGWEVVNTTSDLAVQVLATHYRATSAVKKNVINSYNIANDTSITFNATGAFLDQIPRLNTDAINYHAPHQWHAKFGSYVTVPMTTTDNPLVTFSAANTAVIQNKYITPPKSWLPLPVLSPIILPVQVYTSQQQAFANVATCGAFYTGLSDSTTLTVKVKIYLERAPVYNLSSEVTLVSLAQKAPAKDYYALELYSRALLDMPVAVKNKANGLGTWFAKIANAMVSAAAPMLALIPHPAAKVASVGLAGLGPSLTSLIQEKISQEKKKDFSKKMNNDWDFREKELEKEKKRRMKKEKKNLEQVQTLKRTNLLLRGQIAKSQYQPRPNLKAATIKSSSQLVRKKF